MFNQPFYRESLAAACAGVNLKDKSILVTGATGLIGSFLVETLAHLNETGGAKLEIYAAGRSESGIVSRFGTLAEQPYFHCVPYDATKPVAFDFAANIVVHAATSAHPMAYATDPVGILQANLFGTARLLETLKEQGRGRFLLLSTGETYGENPDLKEGFSETDHGWIDPMLPRACYPEGKRAAETLCASYAAQYGVDALVARLSYVYGPTLSEANTRADAQFLRKALAGEDIVLKSEGTQVRTYTYVTDAIAGLLTLLLRGQERRGYSAVSHAVQRGDKLEALGWTPRRDIREGLRRTLAVRRGVFE